MSSDGSDEKSDPHNAHLGADDLLQRCNALCNELETFREHLKTQKREQEIELGHYRGVVKSELKNLERISQRSREPSGNTENGALHHVASSNLPFLESVWIALKSTTGIVAVQKRFYWGAVAEEKRLTGCRTRQRCGPKLVGLRKGKALVDVVARDGLEWIKVSLITNHRMLMDKAKEGWGGSSSESEDDENGDGTREDTDSGIPIVRMAEALVKASKSVRIRTRNPQVRLILPKIVEGVQPEIDNIIGRLRGAGIIVECSDAAPPPRNIDDVLGSLLTDPFASLTNDVNIDCTILLALVSDFSHCAVSAEPWFHRALKRQLELEDRENLLPNMLYPAICGRKLVATREAVKRMREIVETIGTEGEKARTALFMGDEKDMDCAALRAGLQDWSKFEVPADLNLPVIIVERGLTCDGLPRVAEMVKATLSAINQSVFLYGWSLGITTITSNRTVVKQIDNVLAEEADAEEDWPRIWLCPTARSLVGKEKGRRD